MAIGLGLYATLPAHPQPWEIVAHGMICGIGFGFFQAPNNRELMGSAPRSKIGSAAGVLASVRLTGQTIGAALVAIIFGTIGAAISAGAEHVESVVREAMPVALWLAAACATAAMLASGLRLLAARRSAPARAT
jgi:DHA2 family multidrug resistance protein-like MFS transporter